MTADLTIHSTPHDDARSESWRTLSLAVAAELLDSHEAQVRVWVEDGLIDTRVVDGELCARFADIWALKEHRDECWWGTAPPSNDVLARSSWLREKRRCWRARIDPGSLELS
jgi:hypothetical protein